MLNGPQIILSLCLDIPSETVHSESCSVQTQALLITNSIGNNNITTVLVIAIIIINIMPEEQNIKNLHS